MAPLGQELEISKRTLEANHTHRLAGAVQHIAAPRPGVRRAVHVYQVGLADRLPAWRASVDERAVNFFGWRARACSGKHQRENSGLEPTSSIGRCHALESCWQFT